MVVASLKKTRGFPLIVPLMLVLANPSCTVYEPDLIDTIPDSTPDVSKSVESDSASPVQTDSQSRSYLPEHDTGSEPLDPNDDGGFDSTGDAECVPLADADSVEDCCPDDPDKTEPGVCGCGVSDADSDSDGTQDCIDECPNDPDKTEPGNCGCGVPDDGDICGLRIALVHRYSFEGSGTVAEDSVGGSDGTVFNTTLSDTGDLELTGTDSNQYIDLENGLISQLVNASFEVWITWHNDDTPWQRIFDFGDNDNNEDEQGEGTNYIYLTPRSNDSTNEVCFGYTELGYPNELRLTASNPLPNNEITHIVAVVDDTRDLMQLYINGTADPTEGVSFTGSLSNIDDVNNWLGRSQFDWDPDLDATLHEFRIYNTALTASQIQTSYEEGPDADFLD